MFINETGVIGTIIAAGVNNVGGSITAVLFVILLFLIVFALMFGIPLEFMSIIILPFCLGVGAYYHTFIIPITVICVYFAALIAKNWFFK